MKHNLFNRKFISFIFALFFIAIAVNSYALDIGDTVPIEVETIAELRTHSGNLTSNKTATVSGYYFSGDGGGGPKRLWSPGAGQIDTGASIIVPGGTIGSVSTVGAWVWPTLDYVDVAWFGEKTSVTTQRAVDHGAAAVYMSAGAYTWTSPVTVPSNMRIYGDDDLTQIDVPTDIKTFISESSIWGATIESLFIKKTVITATTVYDIHFTDPSNCKIKNVHIQSGHLDNQYSSTNVGGIFFEKISGASYLNRVENCWIQNNSIYFYGITVSVIKGGYVWGHTREFAIRIGGGGSGAIGIENVVGIICSKFNGGIWLDGAGINQIRIKGNEFDGNPILDTGDGIYSPDATIGVTVVGNTFWGCDKNGINVVDPYGWSVTGNTFWKNNAGDNFFDDIRITGVTSATGNTVSGNTHVIDDARSNKGYAIKEVNLGTNPVSNTYSAESVSGNYQLPAFLFLSKGSQAPLTSAIDIPEHDRTSFKASASGVVIASTGTIDLLVAPEFGDFVGTLFVSNTRSDFVDQSRQATYSLIGRGNTYKLTPIDSFDGVGGGASFTITMPSVGIVRVTNTFTNGTNVKIAFYGLQGF